jgi:hypothetical protein
MDDSARWVTPTFTYQHPHRVGNGDHAWHVCVLSCCRVTVRHQHVTLSAPLQPGEPRQCSQWLQVVGTHRLWQIVEHKKLLKPSELCQCSRFMRSHFESGDCQP